MCCLVLVQYNNSNARTTIRDQFLRLLKKVMDRGDGRQKEDHDATLEKGNEQSMYTYCRYTWKYTLGKQVPRGGSSAKGYGGGGHALHRSLDLVRWRCRPDAIYSSETSTWWRMANWCLRLQLRWILVCTVRSMSIALHTTNHVQFNADCLRNRP